MMTTHKRLAGITIASALMLCGCDTNDTNDESTHRILPLIAVDEDGVQGLAGTYDTESNEVWLVDNVTSATWELVAEMDIDDPQMVIFSQDDAAVNGLSSYVSRFDDASTAQVASLEEGETMRACVVADGLRWTISDFVIGTPADLDELAEFIPTALSREDDEPEFCNDNGTCVD